MEKLEHTVQFLRDMICETCLYADHCDGNEFAPFCFLELSGEYPSEKDFESVAKALLGEGPIPGSVPDKAEVPSPERNPDPSPVETPEQANLTQPEPTISGPNLLEFQIQDNENLVGFLTGLLSFLNANGFSLAGECLDQMITICSSLSVSITDEFSMEQYLRPVLVKNQEEYMAFHNLFSFYWKNRDKVVVDKATESKIRMNLSKKESCEQRIKNKEAEIKQRMEELERLRKKTVLENETAEREKLGKSFKKIEKEYRKLAGKRKEAGLKEKLIAHATGTGQPESRKEANQIESALKEMLKQAVILDRYKEVMAFLKSQIKRLRDSQNDGWRFQLQEKEEAMSQAKLQQRELQEQLDQLMTDMKRQATVIWKEGSMTHRETFIREKARNAVQSESIGELAALDKAFHKLTQKEKDQIKDYIRDNTRKFRTRLLRNMNTTNREKLDLSETCRKACETGGIPLRLYFKKKRKSQAKVMLFLDLSGSCKEVSELMLFFMYTMKEIFPGGCLTYVFINQLYDVSGFMDAPDADTAVSRIMESIPRAGAYSNYYRPFEDFYQSHMSEISSDTLVFFIGDARNNKNETGEEYVKAIARKCKKAFWMNADPYKYWDQGDSVISVYAKYMNMVEEVLTPNDLIGFLTRVH